MKTKVFIFAGILALTNASCTDALSDEIKPGKRTVIYANSPGDGTASRSAIDPTQYGGGHVGILWTPGDALGAFGASARNARFDCQATAPAGRAQFAGACDDPTLAYYPYDAANDGREASALSGSLPAVQTYDSATGILEGDYKIGKPRSGAENEFDFTHIFSLLRFNVDATGTAIEGQNLRSVEIALPEGRALAGDFTFSAVDGSYTFTGNTTATLKVKWSDTPALESGTTFTAYMSAAPDLHADDEVTITVSTSTHRAVIRKQIAYDFAPNMVYTFNLTLNTFSAAEMTVEEIPAEPEEETANCYMITEAGRHDFKATVIGNGQKGIIPGAGFHTDDASIDPSSAKLLWEDVNGFVTDVELRDGRVYYTTSGNVGNAVIAVYSGSNATGNILWSWHIWGVGDNLPEDYEYATKDGVVNQIMDRDLGAFPATDEQRLQTTRVAEDEDYVCHAMMYQWGRKDPMPNSLKRYVDGQEVDLTSFPVWKGASQADHTIAASIQHPTELINRYEGNDDGDWLGQDVELLWGDAKFSGSDKTGHWTNVKTIYDPSPVGYRVPNYYAFTSFIPVNRTEMKIDGISSYSTVDGVKVPALSNYINCVIDQVSTSTWLPKGIHKTLIGKAGGSSANADKIFGYGIYMKRTDDDTEGAYYPAVGYLFPNMTTGNRSDFAKLSYRWLSCGAVSNTTGKGCMYLGHFYWKTSSYSSGVDAGLSGKTGVNGYVRTQYSSYPWNAYAVRCVRDVK